MRPRRVAPGLKGSVKTHLNQAPNSAESVIARHTRARVAFSNTCFSIRSVVVVLMVSSVPDVRPFGCPLDARRRRKATIKLRDGLVRGSARLNGEAGRGSGGSRRGRSSD